MMPRKHATTTEYGGESYGKAGCDGDECVDGEYERARVPAKVMVLEKISPGTSGMISRLK